MIYALLGDRLLPLTTEEESPFPTLQEVEEMSNQRIQLAHGNRDLPKTDNPIWKSETAEKADEDTSTEIDQADEILNEATECENLNETATKVISTPTYIGHKIPEEFLIKAGLVGNDKEDETQSRSLYPLQADGSIQGTFFFETFQNIEHKNNSFQIPMVL